MGGGREKAVLGAPLHGTAAPPSLSVYSSLRSVAGVAAGANGAGPGKTSRYGKAIFQVTAVATLDSVPSLCISSDLREQVAAVCDRG